MATFTEEHHTISGIDTAVFTAGDGPPFVFFHGAGTATGFDALLPLADRFRLIVPHHPGYGASADDPAIDSIQDYLLHYLDLFDALELDEFALAGHSMGGYMAAMFAIDHPERIRSLVLASPIGLRVPEHPVIDIFAVPDEEIFSYLSPNQSLFENAPPPTPELLAARYREMTSTARAFWNRVYDVKLPRWLHRLTMPTLLLWGEEDRLVPAAQAPVWAESIPGVEVKILPGVGHLLFGETPEAVEALADFAAEKAQV
jgi:pimeloyl-ACP methyl ester carboxylesterase